MFSVHCVLVLMRNLDNLRNCKTKLISSYVEGNEGKNTVVRNGLRRESHIRYFNTFFYYSVTFTSIFPPELISQRDCERYKDDSAYFSMISIFKYT